MESLLARFQTQPSHIKPTQETPNFVTQISHNDEDAIIFEPDAETPASAVVSSKKRKATSDLRGKPDIRNFFSKPPTSSTSGTAPHEGNALRSSKHGRIQNVYVQVEAFDPRKRAEYVRFPDNKAPSRDHSCSDDDDIKVASPPPRKRSRKDSGSKKDREVKQAAAPVSLTNRSKPQIVAKRTLNRDSHNDENLDEDAQVCISNLEGQDVHQVQKRGSSPASESTPLASLDNNSRPRRSAAKSSDYVVFDHNISDDDETEFIAPKKQKKSDVQPKRQSALKTSHKNESDSDFEAMDSDPGTDISTGADPESDDESSNHPTSDEEDTPRAKPRNAFTELRSKPQKPSAFGGPSRALSARMENLMVRKGIPKGLSTDLAPLFEIDQIFMDMTKKALLLGLDPALKQLKNRKLKIATMCSGTESPLLAMQMIQESLKSLTDANIEMQHLFSAEIVPFKQAYIERNFSPPLIFRDITELTSAVNDPNPHATTAYGGKMPVPLELSLLIAGTSCVDMSRLNSFRKDLDQGGESDKTWHAVLAYCRAFRPAIVLLENVRSAEWDNMLTQYEEIGYECSGVLVDTKDFYIPQTRQRGYMACFDKSKYPAGLTGISTKWQKLMSSFRRPASAPVSSFLQPDHQVHRQQIRNDEPIREVDWAVCEISQMQYRQDKRLGIARPITHWSESGSFLGPENSYVPWLRKQSERVLDTIDVCVLRNSLPAKGMFDSRFKTRIWNLSQNVYRDEDGQPFGISGCITPSGSFYISDAHRVMSPEESLKLQGLPLSRISFTTESASEMQDLAGNAMTTTVIGSSILSALIAGFEMLPEYTKDSDLPTMSPDQDYSNSVREPFQVHNSQSEEHHLDVREVLKFAERSQRRCFCENYDNLIDRTLQECQDCHHTTCMSCGGNPVHNYKQMDPSSLIRTKPAEFEAYLRSRLPLRMSFKKVPDLRKLVTDSGTNKSYADIVKAATSEVFAFSGIRRSHCWTVHYEGAGARLDLSIGSQTMEWRLFVHPPVELTSNSRLREILTHPVAHCGVTDSLFGKQWKWHVPVDTKLQLNIKGRGSKIASWWSRNGMPDFANHFVWEYLDIEAQTGPQTGVESLVAGSYKYLPLCGKACDSLFVKLDVPSDKEPLYLFLDPSRVGSPDQDCFVLSPNIAHLEYNEVRPIVGRIPDWKPWSLSPTTATAQTSRANFLIDMRWEKSLTSLRPLDMNLSMRTPSVLGDVLARSSCSKACPILTCIVPQELDTSATTSDIASVRANDIHAKHAWVFENMRRFLPSDEWTELRNEEACRDCLGCVPNRPALRWRLGGDGLKILPYDDPESAAIFERAIKSRPDPLALTVTPTPEGTNFTFGINVVSLAQRATKRLLVNVNRQDDGNGGLVTCSWRMNTNSTKGDTFTFKPFHLQATDGISPYTNDLNMSVQLFPKQMVSLAWMRQQEVGDGTPFVVEEAEEASLPSLDWRLEVRAQATVHVRGGICADHPGFGKTITSLALIQTQFLESTKAEIEDELKIRQPDDAHGLIPVSATLIVCPNSLLTQWVSEIQDKLHYKSEVIKIASMPDLSKYSIKSFQNAKIIVVNRSILASEAYIERLAAFAAVPGPATNSGRSFLQWLRFASRQIPEHLRILQQQGAKKLQQQVSEMYSANVKSETFKAIIPSRRLRGKDYSAEKDKRKTKLSQNAKAASSTVETRFLDKPLFEMFYFNRIIIDEFHQYEPKEYFAIVALKADKRWGLSATPAIGDFYEMAQMAGLLGIPLRLGSDARGIMKAKSVRELRKDATDFELFDAMRQKPSDTMQSRIYEQDQTFLDTFVRQNIMDFDDMPYKDHLVPVSLDLDHRALYAELCQHLNSMDMRIRKGSKVKTSQKGRFLNESVETAQSAEEALSRAAAFSERTGDRRLGLKTLIRHREQQVQSIVEELPDALAAARKAEKGNFDKWVDSRIYDKALGDQDTTQTISAMLKDLSGAHPSSQNSSIKKETNAPKISGPRAQTSRVNGLCTRLLTATRSLRYLQNISQLQSLVAAGQDTTKLCSHSNCVHDPSAKVAISALCGHPICESCHIDLRRRAINRCPADGCASPLHDYHLLWSNKLGILQKPTSSPHGAKLAAALSLLQQIARKSDQAILFVQFPHQLDEAELALRDAGIPATIVKKLTEAGAQIAAFRDSAADPSTRKTVIVLNVSDETAAGSNLQNANHVLFLSPLLRDSQYGYDATMAQAIGRVRRHGQQKPIHVYRLLALDSIDVDILEHRERRRDALVEHGHALPRPPLTPPSTQPPPREKTQLVRENGHFSLRPQSWLVSPTTLDSADAADRVKGRSRVLGWEDFSSLVKFSRAFTEDDE